MAKKQTEINVTVQWWVQTQSGRIEGERAGVTLEDAVSSAIDHITTNYPNGAARVYYVENDIESTEWRREGFR